MIGGDDRRRADLLVFTTSSSSWPPRCSSGKFEGSGTIKGGDFNTSGKDGFYDQDGRLPTCTERFTLPLGNYHPFINPTHLYNSVPLAQGPVASSERHSQSKLWGPIKSAAKPGTGEDCLSERRINHHSAIFRYPEPPSRNAGSQNTSDLLRPSTSSNLIIPSEGLAAAIELFASRHVGHNLG